MPPFDPAFALNFMLPFAEAAYDVAAKQTPLMPPGYTVKSTIVADAQQIANVMAVISLPHQRMVRAMVADNPIMGFVGRCDTTQTVASVFGDTILTPRVGRPIAPKGATQKRYVDLVRANDIVFAIGPAG